MIFLSACWDFLSSYDCQLVISCLSVIISPFHLYDISWHFLVSLLKSLPFIFMTVNWYFPVYLLGFPFIFMTANWYFLVCLLTFLSFIYMTAKWYFPACLLTFIPFMLMVVLSWLFLSVGDFLPAVIGLCALFVCWHSFIWHVSKYFFPKFVSFYLIENGSFENMFKIMIHNFPC